MRGIDKKYVKLRISTLLQPIISDEMFVRIQYRLKTGQKLNLRDPKTYNEKIQWIKLNYKNPLMHQCVDKYEVRDYVKRKVGADVLIPLLGVYDAVEEIDFNVLPSKFIVKLTNGSSFNYISYKKDQQDVIAIQDKFRRWIKTNYYALGREWAYKGVPNRIIIEDLLQTSAGHEPNDYRFFCFNGKVEYITIDFDSVVNGIKTSNYKRNVYNQNWQLVEGQINYPNKKTENLEITDKMQRMVEMAERLAEDFPAVRVDFYYFDDKIYFGELTFYHASGYQAIRPSSLALRMGSLIDINSLKDGKA